MGFALLWIEFLLLSLLLTAHGVRVAAKASGLLRRGFHLCIAVALPLAGSGLALFVSYLVWAQASYGQTWFCYVLSWIAAYAIASGMIAWRGLRQRTGEPVLPGPRWRKLLAAASLVLSIAATIWGMNWASHVYVAALKAEAQTSWDANVPAVPESPNAALAYREAARNRPNEATLANAPALVNWSKPNFKADSEEVRQCLVAHAETLRLTREGVARSRGNFLWRPWTDPMELSGLSNVRTLVRILGLSAQAGLEGKKRIQAIHDINGIFVISNQLQQSASLTQFSIGVSVRATGLEALETALARQEFSPEELAQFSFAAPLPPNVMAVQTAGLERACVLFGSAETAEQMTGWRLLYLSNEVGVFERELQSAQPLLADPDGKKLEVWKSNPAREHGLFDMPLIPMLTNSVLDNEARHRLALTALAVARFRAREGQFPAKLADLVPAFLASVPEDPFDRAPLRWRWRRTSSGPVPVLYSVGRNCVDDPPPERCYDRKGSDIVFQFYDKIAAANGREFG